MTYPETIPDQTQRYEDMLEAYYWCMENENYEDAYIILYQKIPRVRTLIKDLFEIEARIIEREHENKYKS